jgi:phenylalanine-4-hydroxylase
MDNRNPLPLAQAEERLAELLAKDLDAMQRYDEYTTDDLYTWSTVFSNLFHRAWPERAHPEFLQGIDRLRLMYHVPKVSELSKRLQELVGCQLYFVEGHTDPTTYLLSIARNYFPVTVWLRKPLQIGYIEEPDMVHEVLGHAVMLSNKLYFIHHRRIAQVFIDIMKQEPMGTVELLAEWIARFYWRTIEFGLTRDDSGKLRVYGVGILSSAEETIRSLEPGAQHVYLPDDPHDACRVLIEEPYELDESGNYTGMGGMRTYYVVNGFHHFHTMVNALKEVVMEKLGKEAAVAAE